MDTDLFTIDCTGDAVTGDVILFAEAVFGGSYRKPRFLGERRVIAEIVADSYGAARQQHTFTLTVIDSDGYDPLPRGLRTTRKGRNVYKDGTKRTPWPDEAARRREAGEKHARGDAARAARDERKNGGFE